jgi:hypothetical protein
MSPPIDDRYFEWLYSQFGAVRNRNPARSYWELSKKLYSTEFVWIVPNDDNRVEDGKCLRDDFMHEQGSDGVTDEWMTLGCSILEMLVALAQRASDVDDREPSAWIETFFKNLGLIAYTDKVYASRKNPVSSKINRILEDFIYRNYKADGEGGLFPLRHPKHDQTKVELWYQLNEYVLENE